MTCFLATNGFPLNDALSRLCINSIGRNNCVASWSVWAPKTILIPNLYQNNSQNKGIKGYDNLSKCHLLSEFLFTIQRIDFIRNHGSTVSIDKFISIIFIIGQQGFVERVKQFLFFAKGRFSVCSITCLRSSLYSKTKSSYEVTLT